MTYPAWLEQALAAVSRVRVAVFGDFALDAYWYLGDPEGEVSVETGRPVQRVAEQSYSLGGAGNVAVNVASLGVVEVKVVGVVGEDLFGRELRLRLEQAGVDTEHLITVGDWQTTVFAKPHVGREEQDRIDFGTWNKADIGTIEELTGRLDGVAYDCDAVILNQQLEHGLSRKGLIAHLNSVIADHAKTPFVVDSRHRWDRYKGAVHKLNRAEIGCEDDDINAVARTAAAIERDASKPLFVTDGGRGMIAIDGGETYVVPAIPVRGEVDPVGAGDTVIAAIAAALAAGVPVPDTLRFANLAAAVTVSKLGTTGTASPDELRELAGQEDT